MEIVLQLSLCLVLAGVVAASGMTPNTTRACMSYRCGPVHVRYPFWIDMSGNGTGVVGTNGNGTGDAMWSRCGYPSLRLECRGGTPVMRLPSGDYAVSRIRYGGADNFVGDRTFSLVDLSVLMNSSCPFVAGRNLTLPAGSPPPLSLTRRDTNVTFYTDCTFFGIPSQIVPCLETADGRHTYVFRDGQYRMPYDYAALCKEIVGMPVLHSSLLNSKDDLDAIIQALNMGFELSWRPAVGGDCADCEKTRGLCGQRRVTAHGDWIFTCFTTANKSKVSPSWVARKSSGLFMGLIVGGGISLICLLAAMLFVVQKLRERQPDV